jgi:hypothetical protein
LDFQATAPFLPAGNWAVADALLQLAEIKKAFKKSSTRLKPFNGKRLRRVFSA